MFFHPAAKNRFPSYAEISVTWCGRLQEPKLTVPVFSLRLRFYSFYGYAPGVQRLRHLGFPGVVPVLPWVPLTQWPSCEYRS
jgi:hypothetical protein